MSKDISKVARNIAINLDSKDKDGRNGKIDKTTWNAFALNKGRSIQNYIGIDAATRSISIYMTREAKKTGENKYDIGQNWLNGTNPYTIDRECQLREVVVEAPKPKQEAHFAEPKLAPSLEVELKTALVLPPQPLKSRDIATDTPDNTEENPVSAVDNDIVIPALNIEQMPVLSSIVSLEPAKSDQELFNEAPAGCRVESNQFIYLSDIMAAMAPLQIKWSYLNNTNLLNKVTSVLANISQENISVANIIKILKENLYGEIQKAFHYNTINSSKFIHEIAHNVVTEVNNRNNQGSRKDIVRTAQNYCDANIKSQAEGNVYFSNNHRRAWCADTVSTILLESLGDNIADEFSKTSSVSELRNWGKRNGTYMEVSYMKSETRKNYIANHVKPGDIMIEKRNKSHTGIVVEVAPDGSWFRTIEGNASKSVATRTYTSDSKTLSGFISMDKYTNDNDAEAGES